MVTNFDIFKKQFTKKKYWKLRIRKSSKRILPYLEIPLEKLGMDKEDIEHWKSIFKYTNVTDYVYLYQNRKGEWKFAYTVDGLSANGCEDYEYGGEVTYDKDDLEIYKLKKVANKYNL